MLNPILALIIWTLIVWTWMYATRIPAMRKAKVNPQAAIHARALEILPTDARVVADNYNHLHEAPTLFYALAFYLHLAGVADGVSVALAWAYVALRVAHSFAQIVLKVVMVRFGFFMLSTVVLMALALRGLLTVL